jgi:hypothetical protein
MRKLLLFSAVFTLVAAFSSCKGKEDDKPNGGDVNVTVDYSHIIRPAKGNRYRIFAQDETRVMELEKKTVNLPIGTYPIFTSSMPMSYDIQGSVFTLPLDADGFMSSSDLGWEFGTSVDTITVVQGALTPVQIRLDSIPILVISIEVDSGANRVRQLTATMDGMIGAWDYMKDQPVGNPITIRRSTNGKTDGSIQYDFSMMYLGYHPNATSKLKVDIVSWEGANYSFTLEDPESITALSLDRYIATTADGSALKMPYKLTYSFVMPKAGK